jgi:hypothetical protein
MAFSLGIVYPNDPVYQNLFVVNFDDKYMKENCYKMDEKYSYFYANEINEKIVPLEHIYKLVKNKEVFDLSIYIYNKTGAIIQLIILEDFQYTKLKDVLNFDYGFSDIMKLRVRYKYKNMVLYNDYNKYLRKKKLENIKKISE